MTRSRATSQGFTRIEAMVLGVAVSLFVVLQAPLLGANRIQSRATACLDNLQRLAVAFRMYAVDGDGWLPPNMDFGSATPGHAWVVGPHGVQGRSEFDPSTVANPAISLLAPYLSEPTVVFHCPADTREGLYQGTDPSLIGQIVPAVRSVSMSVAVGTHPEKERSKQPTDAPWLDNNHSHWYGRTWYTYGREEHFLSPGPSSTVVFLEEDARSINDGLLAFGMERAEWLDWLGTRHNFGDTLSFADGHVESHRWEDPRTRAGPILRRQNVPQSVDWMWLQERISARIQR